ncbi:MAG: hypothetical protein KJ731_19745 [Alphaproteobacteria bacterium]|jgi:hypothetical protein|uniref:Uncharacterized protein n=1 Tax=Celeribacter baekdonensis TaxID=875171 RepID=A0A1G7SRA1_9RHOB|nr:hypothetical protein [Celeribacter baekdonensis]MBU0644812.1 hypothetical protein [Alphaproteobacteria bacterium]MBU1281462.1 hypothetical protein [Alphaproteobacteria bacterium]MBU1571709.1 hypothetical protein [Alphaproteobacteria bacterium]MBU1830683.1 hypothetical protein [Alphaproteobacteria bacterium]MBU2078562.1 hypothetical protein [Alphaproteobacteria bacterium]|tara:strand:- start:365 stop:502 length:138 start_codon:yes stop_codon:yes gene_type:complete
MTMQRKPRNIWLKAVLTIGLIGAAMATLHFALNSDIVDWLRSLHG